MENLFWNVSDGYNISGDSYASLIRLNNEAALRFLPVTLFIVFLMVIGLVGNVIVCIVYYKRKRKSTSDLFILNLAALDLLSCLFGIPMEVADLSLPYMFNAPTVCRIGKTLESCTILGSAMTLVFISIDRYKLICNMGESFSYKTAKRLCLASLCFGIFLSWPFLILMGKKTVDLGLPDIKGVDCAISDDFRKTIVPLVFNGILFVCFVLSLVFMIFVYVRISIFLKRSKTSRLRHIEERDVSISIAFTQHTHSGQVRFENMDNTELSDVNDLHQEAVRQLAKVPKRKSAVKVTRTTTIFVAITIVFIISFLPFLVVMTLLSTISDIEKEISKPLEVFMEFCLKTYFLNNAINPLIYSVLSIRFRQDVKRLFSK